MKTTNTVIAAMHRRNKIETIITILAFFACTGMAFYAGYSYRQLELIDSSEYIFKEKKTIYTVEDLEILLFGEPQQ